MSNLLKSKFFLGVMIVAAFAVTVAVSAPTSASAATCSITSTLRVGSKGAQVMCLQSALGITADGSFGPMTKAAVIAFQTSHGLTADGIFGPMSRAAWLGMSSGTGVTYPAGCMSNTGFSSTTGMSCSGVVNVPAGCTSTSGFSTTTGMSCSGGSTTFPAGCTSSSGYSSTTGVSCATGSVGVVNPNGSGNISSDSLLGGFANTIVGTGDVNHQVAGFTLTGAGGGSNVTLQSLTLSFNAAPFSGSCSSSVDCGSGRLSDYFSAVSIWENGVQVGSVPASAFTSNSIAGLNNYVYSASIPLSGATVQAGVNTNFYIAVTANTSIDTGNFTSGNKWAVQVGNIRYTDGTGVTLVYNPTSTFPTTWQGTDAHTPADPSFSFGTAANANNIVLNIGRAGSDQNAHTVTVNATGNSTSKVPLLQMTLTSQGGVPIAINKIPVVFTPVTNSVYQFTGEVYLMNGSTVLDSEVVNSSTGSGGCNVAATACTISFKIPPNPGLVLQPGSSLTLTVAADINSVSGGGYTAGKSLTVSTPIGSTAFDLTSGTPQGTELVTSSNATTLIPGTANGQAVAFYATGASVNETSDVCTASNGGAGDPSSLTCTIQYSVTANGAPVYIPQAADTTAADTSHINFGAFVSTAPNTPIVSASSPAINLTATVTQNGTVATSSQSGAEWTIPAGATANFTGTVVIYDSTSAHAGQYRAYLQDVPWSSTSTAGPWTTGDYNFNLGSSNVAVPGFTFIN